MLIALPIFSSNIADSNRAVCLNNLRRIGQAYQLWGNDYEDRFPFQVPHWEGGIKYSSSASQVYRQFAVLSNELRDPGFLACPTDPAGVRAGDFFQLVTVYRDRAVSYFLSHGPLGLGPELLAGDKNVTGLSSGFSSCEYFVQTRVMAPQLAAWHNLSFHAQQGNALLANGAVEQFSNAGLRAAAGSSDVHLSVPEF
jgi:hypothetical protein